jgi:hypothetical protein
MGCHDTPENRLICQRVIFAPAQHQNGMAFGYAVYFSYA